ncbi:hypothetical protein [Oricola cellulosilytica]|uniref:Uncharacterized protein n=1 Tax=Oricola cellulosilytica TaxID=1429082 RepID=A0A4R0PA30_9HYPH|nr:hypothetical protein [Oricola cellulosilytica]TCD14110.1 hypothetical protein E0D97_08425 [Oricola cellulosilytica]
MAARRHTRRKELHSLHVKRFVKLCVRCHGEMMPISTELHPTSPQAKAIDRLSDAIKNAIREVSGEEPPWPGEAHGAGPGWRDPDGTRSN